MRGWASLLVLAPALLACSAGDDPCVPLSASGASWCLLPPASAPAFSVLSQIELEVPTRSETLLAQVENDTQTLRAALLTPLGQRLALVSLRAERIERQAQSDAARPDARVLLVLVQLLRWPEEALRAQAQAQGLDFRAERNTRHLFDAAGRLLASAHCEQAQCQLGVPSLEMRLKLIDLPAPEPTP